MSFNKYENVLLDEAEDGIAVLTINRPKALNALNLATLQDIGDALREVKARDDIRVLIVTGSSAKSFVAGADIKEMQNDNVTEALKLSKLAHSSFGEIEHLPQFVIAAVNGYALGGGCELACSCDMRIGSTKAKVGQPETGLGIIPGFGGTQRLTRVVGRGKAKELIATCDMIDAKEAYRIGLFDELAEPDELMDKAKEIAHKIMKNAPLSVARAKYSVDRGADLPLDIAIDLESQIWAEMFGTADQKEGMAGFIEKREKSFTGK